MPPEVVVTVNRFARLLQLGRQIEIALESRQIRFPRRRFGVEQGRVAGETAESQIVVVVEHADTPPLGGIEVRRVSRPARDDRHLQPIEPERRAMRDGDVDRDVRHAPGAM